MIVVRFMMRFFNEEFLLLIINLIAISYSFVQSLNLFSIDNLINLIGLMNFINLSFSLIKFKLCLYIIVSITWLLTVTLY